MEVGAVHSITLGWRKIRTFDRLAKQPIVDPGGILALSDLPQTLAELRRHRQFSEECVRSRRVKDELRDNLITRLRRD